MVLAVGAILIFAALVQRYTVRIQTPMGQGSGVCGGRLVWTAAHCLWPGFKEATVTTVHGLTCKVKLVAIDKDLKIVPALASFVSQLQPIQASASAGDGTGLLAQVPAFFSSLATTLAVGSIGTVPSSSLTGRRAGPPPRE